MGIVVHLVILLVLIFPTDSLARRSSLSSEQKTQLSHIQTIRVSALALTEKGFASPELILQVVQRRFEELGFLVVTDASELHDVEFHIICEERKHQQSVPRYGTDAELTNTPDRLWNGPACQLSYRLEGRDLGWHKEVHPSNREDALIPREEQILGTDASVFEPLTRELERLDFPVMLLSEWGQTHRLVVLLTDPQTPPTRRLVILDLLRQFPDSEALPYLLKLIEQGQYSEEAIGALSGLGHEVVPHLQHLFESRDRSVLIRAAAAKGLGRIMRADGDPEVTTVLLKYLSKAVADIRSSSDIEFPVLTEVVWAVGSIHHKPTVKLISTLQDEIWLIYDNSPEMKKLRDVVSVVHKYLDFNQI
ncbi:MAG: HEAT repeat domain-containing protein [Nitrospira sp.]|nr:HEAT repeat domain-containing protein [Nitrospira sp.]